MVTGSPAVTSATVSGLTLGTAYKFRVTATNVVGPGPASTPSAAVTPATTPAAPTKVLAYPGLTTAHADKITVTWTPAVDNGSVLTKNTLTATPVGGGPAVTATVAGGATATGIITGLAEGTPYDVTVTATNAVGTGPASSPPALVMTFTVPNAPTSVVATPGVQGSANLTWAAPGDNGSTITKYTLTPSPACPACTGLTVTGTPAPSSAHVAGLTVGTTYTFTVNATNTVGTGPSSGPSNPVTSAGLPQAPTNLSATPGDSQLTVTWTAPVANGNPVTAYNVTATPVGCPSGCPPVVGVTVGGNPPNTTVVVTGLTNYLKYQLTVTATNAAGTGPASSAITATPGKVQGYWVATAQGGVYAYGGAGFYGAASAFRLNSPIITITSTSDGNGYWQVGADGGIFTFGDAQFFGSTGNIHLNLPVVGMAPTADDKGYWLVASDGGVFAFGDAHYYGSLPAQHVHVSDIVGMVRTADGGGYWMIGSDGGVFAFGDAKFVGSLPGIGVHTNDIVSITPTHDGGGYWMVGSDGGVFAFGDAFFVGSLAGLPLASPVVDMTSTPSGTGYWILDRQGDVFAKGTATDQGSPAGLIAGQQAVGIASSD